MEPEVYRDLMIQMRSGLLETKLAARDFYNRIKALPHDPVTMPSLLQFAHLLKECGRLLDIVHQNEGPQHLENANGLTDTHSA